MSVKAARLADSLEEQIRLFVNSGDQNLGDIEMELEQQSRELLRQAAEKAAQKKADLTPPVCPACQSALSQVSRDHARSFECRFGTLTLRRTRGYCRKCRKWRFPADMVLGLEEIAGYIRRGCKRWRRFWPPRCLWAMPAPLDRSEVAPARWIGKRGNCGVS